MVVHGIITSNHVNAMVTHGDAMSVRGTRGHPRQCHGLPWEPWHPNGLPQAIMACPYDHGILKGDHGTSIVGRGMAMVDHGSAMGDCDSATNDHG